MRTTVLRVLTLTAGLLVWCVVAAAGDDPPPDSLKKAAKSSELKQDEPPDRLQRRLRPPEPPGVPPPGAQPKSPAGEKAKSDSQPKRLRRPEGDPDVQEDPEKLKEQIAKDMQLAENKLKAYDPGTETQTVQERVVENLDKLLDIARNPPQSDQDQQQKQGQKGKMGKQKSGQKGQKQGQSGREKRAQRRQQAERLARGQQQRQQGQQQGQDQQDQDQQQANRNNPRFGGGNTPRGGGQGMSDIVKDIWGHLPETLRQEVDHYYRDQFMPRYRELLQQYYSRLAEQDRARDRP